MTDLENETQTLQPQPARRLYYGWVMLPISMAALIASSPGQTFGVSVFNEPMRLSLDLTHGQLAAAYMLGTLLGALPIAYIGAQMDRYGLRRSMLAVITLFSASCMLTAAVGNWVTLVAAFCCLRMLGPGALSFLSGNTLAFWFDRRLGTVEGLRQLGMAAAMMGIPAVNLWLVSTWGWRGAYAMLGLGVWAVLFPAFMLLFRNRPEEVGQRLDGVRVDADLSPTSLATADTTSGFTLAEALKAPAFWIVAAGMAMFGLVHTAVFFCIVPILGERGLSPRDAALVLTAFAGFLALAQLVGGMLADRVAAPPLLVVGMVGLTCSVALLYFADSMLVCVVAGAAFGASQGLYFGATHPLWPRYFGRLHLGKIRGVLMTLNVSASSIGPLMAGLIRDMEGSFAIALVIFAIAPIPVAVLSIFAVPPLRESLAPQFTESLMPETVLKSSIEAA